ncbi:nucleotide exchange factor GrpE [Desulfolucanica intricata]|uniref:nucleotide exchange factor GrpE n=1 Tax=Desulfolucanica intricata TaxID=1285191 RepID=UPI000B273410|nr:nucleotide exchange factor GrpE [Desulfolucanica intricata]
MGGELEKDVEKVPLVEEDEQVEEKTAVNSDEELEVEVLSPEEEKVDDPEELRRLLKEQTEKAEDYYARLARLQADFENFRRRTRQEKEETVRYATEQLMVDLLPVLDNFERALNIETKENSKDSFMEGMEMIYRQLKDTLSKGGLTVIPAVGEQFDPNKHDAVMQEETVEQPDNTVIEELRRGYMLKDKVIRPAMVKVAKSV